MKALLFSLALMVCAQANAAWLVLWEPNASPSINPNTGEQIDYSDSKMVAKFGKLVSNNFRVDHAAFDPNDPFRINLWYDLVENGADEERFEIHTRTTRARVGITFKTSAAARKFLGEFKHKMMFNLYVPRIDCKVVPLPELASYEGVRKANDNILYSVLSRTTSATCETESVSVHYSTVIP